MSRQKNISRDVQNGVTEIEELMDVIGDYRRNWKTADEERKSSRIISKKTKPLRIAENVLTPSTSKTKRSATSPIDTNPEKKTKGKAPESNPIQHSVILQPTRSNTDPKTPKKKRNKQRKKSRPRRPKTQKEAVIIKPLEGHSYADVLKSLRQNIKPEDADVAVQSISKTKTGSILLVMGKGGEKDKFCDIIKSTLNQAAEVKTLTQKATLEILDLDTLSSQEEVEAMVSKVTNLHANDITVRLTAPNSREQRRAFVTMPVDGANKILMTQRIKIGMTNCRVKYREETKRCFRCFGTGHMQRECKGPDRKGMGLCIRCGETGHKMKECTNSAKCCVCIHDGKSNVNHVPGLKCSTKNKRQAQ